MLGDLSFMQMFSFVKGGALAVAMLAQVGNSTSPPADNGRQPGLRNAQPGTSQAGRGQPSGSSQLGTQGGRQGAGRGAMAGHAQHGQVNDRLLSTCLIVDNEGEIALSEIARQRAQSNEVKQFAEQMVTEHTEMLAKLRQLEGATDAGAPGNGGRGQRGPAGAAAADRPSQGSAAGDDGNTVGGTGSAASQPANQNQAAAPTQTGTAQVGGAAGTQGALSPNNSFAALKRELGAQCLQSKRQELESKQGAEFDKCFMGMQLAMHMDTLDVLHVFQRHAQGELRQVIEEAIPKVTAHLDHAKMTMQKLDSTAATPSDATSK